MAEKEATEIEELIAAARTGDSEAGGRLLERERAGLLRMVRLRMDPRLQARFDPSDVVQDAFLDATRRLPAWIESREMPFFAWLRFLVRQKLDEFRRRHLGAGLRDARREVGAEAGDADASTIIVADRLSGTVKSPSANVTKAEVGSTILEALASMDRLDREVLVLRHFEQLTHAEAARELGLSEAAASRRYIRALSRMAEVLARLGVSA
jgi:RNA polymerase sigma-70 factor (ECF subfamily)